MTEAFAYVLNDTIPAAVVRSEPEHEYVVAVNGRVVIDWEEAELSVTSPNMTSGEGSTVFAQF